MYTQQFIDKFWAKVDRRGPDECWTWKAGKDNYGYGQISIKGRSTRAHRVALILTVGEPETSGLHGLHDPITCNNPGCCNPSHLRWGTHQDNLADFRQRHGYGNSKDRVKLNRKKGPVPKYGCIHKLVFYGPVRQTRYKSHCINGHEMTPENIYLHRNDHKCRKCRQDARVRARANKKSKSSLTPAKE
jgi:hypothetical protein